MYLYRGQFMSGGTTSTSYIQTAEDRYNKRSISNEILNKKGRESYPALLPN